MKKQALIRALQQAHDWVKQRREGRSTAGEPWQAQNIMVGCVQVINQTGQSVQAWLDRRNRRRLLSDIRNRYLVADGNKALRDLIKLAIAAVGACSTVTDYWLGALPVRQEPQRLTEAQRRARAATLAANAERARREERESLERLRKARLDHEAALRHHPLDRSPKMCRFLVRKRGSKAMGTELDQNRNRRPGLVGVRYASMRRPGCRQQPRAPPT
jgi:hypothetical protein